MSTGKPAARVGDQDTGHGIFGPTPITTGAGSVTIGGKPAARVGDMLAPHHPGARVIMKGSASVTIEGRPAARLGDPINCGGFIAIGEGSVCIGDAPAQLDPAPLSAAFSAYVKALLDPKTKVYSPDELKTLQDSIAVKYEPRFPGDTVGQLKAQYAQQEAAAPLVSESVNHQRTYTTSSTVTPTATPPQAAVDIRVVEADGLPAAGLPYLMTADDGTQRTGTLDALGQAHEPQLPAGQVTVTVGDPTNSTEIRHTRAGLREELARILQAERAEAAQLAAELTEKSAVGVYWAYRKAELRGLWNGTAGLISSLKELSDLALPLAHFQRAAKAAWQAWKHTDESPYLQAFHKKFTDAQFKELADVLGIDPRSITKAQLAEISTLINFLWDDEQTRSILLKFAGQYIEAQHSIEVVETLYATVPEVAFDILITALTLGSGATVVIATKARWIDRLSSVGRLLKQLAQQLKKARGQKSRVGYTGDRVDIEVERPEYQEIEARKHTASQVKSIIHRPSYFASRSLLDSHFEKHVLNRDEFKGAYSTADEYLEGALEVVNNGTPVKYPYRGEERTGFVRFFGTSKPKGSKPYGDAKFEFVGTNNDGYITTYHIESKDFWKTINNDKHHKVIYPAE